MSVLAICSPAGPGSRPDLHISQFHTNLWSFRRKGRRKYVVDYGINLQNGGDPSDDRAIVRAFDLFVPFRVVKATDVTSKLRDQTTAELIFNESCTISGNGEISRLTAGPKVYNLGHVSTKIPVAKPAWSHVSVNLIPPLRGGETRYVRLRLQFTKPRRVIWERGSGLATTLAAYDIRMYEQRQWTHDGELKRLIGERRPIEIHQWQCFLIVSAASVLVEHNPPMKYMRLLEAGEWKNYLDQTVGRSSVYYWKNETKDKEGEDGLGAIGPRNAYRVYAKFRIVNLPVIWLTTWLPAILIVTAALAFADARFGFVDWIGRTAVELWKGASRSPSVSLLIGVVAVLLGVAGRLIPFILKWRKGKGQDEEAT